MANEGPPPAWNETANVGQVPTNTASGTKAGYQAPAAGQEGTGILGSPSRRALLIAVALGLYYTLALPHPIYYMRATAQPCEWTCNNRLGSFSGATGLTGWGTGSSGWSTGSSGSGFDYWGDWSQWEQWANYGVRRRLQLDTLPDGGVDPAVLSGYFSGGQGCLESTDPQCDDYCEEYCEWCNDVDTCKDALDLAYEFGFGTPSKDVRLASWALLVLGLFAGLIGVALVFVFALCKRGVFKMIAGIFMAASAVLVAGGAITFTASWHEEVFEEVFAAWQLLILMEYLLPVSITAFLAVDLLVGFLNSERMRVFCLSGPFVFAGLWCGVLLTYIVNFDYNIVGDYSLMETGGCMAAGYFLVAIFSLARILIWTEVVKLDPIQGFMYRFCVAVLFIIGGFILAVGYWVFVDTVFDCETLGNITASYEVCESAPHYYQINGDVTQATQGVSGNDYMPGKPHWSCYYMGYSLFFILPLTLINAYDMDIVGLFKKVRTASAVASNAP
mmetsp:Transcript_26835/g.43957  ORF Transcript_26835/g.43957 Transcript_26835/m.43957 type:complete len:502 (+) Transcript_26835:214-1719(+)|eukprot:CAMPEP_0202726454 /NCGR_PEP_ID=MMETSP1385-20130828/184620_1 /ASSEMBLY_ACC=CAM_ASM_000861 /TAXON_ID=933848 /ORGANISM="Elphidium margaritaceum" /LENGTH=501 /DNA_ID=CAMNT_0049392675 /DNA_START=727 /DNA_END=2232 /DNA_ORIENTATION=+